MVIGNSRSFCEALLGDVPFSLAFDSGLATVLAMSLGPFEEVDEA